MENLDAESFANLFNALIKSLQTLCHGYLEFNNGIEIIGHINLSVDKGSSMHYILEEKVCKNEENSTLFISKSFHAQNQKSDPKTKGKDTENSHSGSTTAERSDSLDTGETGKLSSAISSISSALTKSQEKSRSGSTSSAKDSETVHSKSVTNTAKRKASGDYSNDVRAAKSSHLSSSPSPVSHFLSQSPHDPSGSSSPVDTKPSVRQLQSEDIAGTVLPQTAGVSADNPGDLGVNLAGSVLERVDDHSNSDLPDRGDDSDGDLEVTFIKEEYVEGEQPACQFESSGGQQYGRGAHQRAQASDMHDASMYPVSLHHSASSTFVPAHDMTAAQHYGPSTSSSQPQPGTSGARDDIKGFIAHQACWPADESLVLQDRKKQDINIERQNKWALSHFKGAYPPESYDSSACDQKTLEATQLFKDWLSGKSMTEGTVRSLTLQQLDTLLCSFYCEVRKRDGTPLKEHALRRLRSGLMKYLSMLYQFEFPFTSLDFKKSNKAYMEMLSKQPSKPTEMLSQADCTLIRSHMVLNMETPQSLLKKVWFELQLHFGTRRWSPREMWPDLFIFITDDDADEEFVVLKRDQLARSHLKAEVKDMLLRRRMNATGHPLCPVEALKRYLSMRERSPGKSSDTMPFLQKPNPQWVLGCNLPWYTSTEISLGKNHNFIRELCEEVRLETAYTNMSLCFGNPVQYDNCWPGKFVPE